MVWWSRCLVPGPGSPPPCQVRIARSVAVAPSILAACSLQGLDDFLEGGELHCTATSVQTRNCAKLMTADGVSSPPLSCRATSPTGSIANTNRLGVLAARGPEKPWAAASLPTWRSRPRFTIKSGTLSTRTFPRRIGESNEARANLLALRPFQNRCGRTQRRSAECYLSGPGTCKSTAS